jgi:hypothetical protein
MSGETVPLNTCTIVVIFHCCETIPQESDSEKYMCLKLKNAGHYFFKEVH